MTLQLKLLSMGDLPSEWAPEWVIEHMLQRGGLNLLFGAPRARKSTLRDYLLACAMLGESPFGRFAVQRKVERALICCGEEISEAESARLHATFLALGADPEAFRRRIYILDRETGFRLDRPDHVNVLLEKVRAESFDFVCFDPLVNFHEQKENEATAMAAVLRSAQRFSHFATTLLLHHEGKPTENTLLRDDMQQARGSSAITGYTLSNLRLTRKGRSNRHKLILDPKYSPEKTEVDLVFSDDLSWHETKLSDFDEYVLQQLKKFPGLSGGGLAEKLGKRRYAILKALKKLKALGMAYYTEADTRSRAWFFGEPVPEASGTAGTTPQED